MRLIRILVWKEFAHLRNDPVSIRLMVFPIFIQLLVLGYAITTEVRNTPLTICDRSRTPQSASLVQSLSNHGLFTFIGMSRTEAEVREHLDFGRAKIGVVIPVDFADDLASGEDASVSLVLDGQDANSSNVAGGYLKAITSQWARGRLVKRIESRGLSIDKLIPVKVQPVILFNPLLKSTWYMVPAMVVLLVTIVTAILTGFSIVREKESGTLEQLLVTPIRTVHLVIGKSLPFVIVGLLEISVALVFAQVWFGIPFRGNYLTVFAFALIYMFSSIGIGMLISTVSQTPFQALFMTWFVLIFFILLSGFFLPIENMPTWVQHITLLNPVRYFIFAVREIFLKGAGPRELWREAVAMGVLGVGVYSAAVVSFRRRVG